MSYVPFSLEEIILRFQGCFPNQEWQLEYLMLLCYLLMLLLTGSWWLFHLTEWEEKEVIFCQCIFGFLDSLRSTIDLIIGTEEEMPIHWRHAMLIPVWHGQRVVPFVALSVNCPLTCMFLPSLSSYIGGASVVRLKGRITREWLGKLICFCLCGDLSKYFWDIFVEKMQAMIFFRIEDLKFIVTRAHWHIDLSSSR